MIGSFAGFVFSVSEDQVKNFISLSREASARYANHEVMGQKAKKEFLGPNLSTGSFTMELSAQQGVSPMAALRVLEQYINSGRSSPFILGGKNLGRYVITKKSEEYQLITKGGQVIKAKVDVTMEEYR